MTESKTTKFNTKPRKMWAAMNYDVIWSVGPTRMLAKTGLCLEMKARGHSWDAVEREVEKRMKDGSFALRRCVVKVLP